MIPYGLQCCPEDQQCGQQNDDAGTDKQLQGHSKPEFHDTVPLTGMEQQVQIFEVPAMGGYMVTLGPLP